MTTSEKDLPNPNHPANYPSSPYQVYLVGGAVRDTLLQHPFHEKDWVVVGATPKQMLEEGFKQVGKDFPVFIHPKTHEEYALARKERKVAKGYHGFDMDYAPTTTLEEDLLRRDLTINAIAQDNEGRYIDPYGGIEDLHNRILRHVSPAFTEDPVRVLRLARFYARYYRYGFTIAPETKALVKEMLANKELEALTPERVWLELTKALGEDAPQHFFYALKELGALTVLFPELASLFGIPQTAEYHPEIDAGIHIMMALEQIAKITSDLPTRYAVLCHDFGKALTPKDVLPSHKHHEIGGIPITQAFSRRLKAPKEYESIALKVTEYHLLMHQMMILRPKTILKLLHHLDAFRNPETLYRYIDACEADAKGRLEFENRPYPQRDYLLTIFNALEAFNKSGQIKEAIDGLDPAKIPDRIAAMRIAVIKDVIKNYPLS